MPPPNSARRIGGWVQTSSNPSPLGCNVTEKARRNMKEKCFNCGVDRSCKSHTARDTGRIEYKCPHPLRGAEYVCSNKECGCKIIMTTRGHAEPMSREVVAPVPVAAQTTATTTTTDAQGQSENCSSTKAGGEAVSYSNLPS